MVDVIQPESKIIGDVSIIEEGYYIGLWFGYYVRIAFQNGRVSEPIATDNGIRGSSRVIVKIKHGDSFIITTDKIAIESLEQTYRVKPEFKRY